MIQNIVIVVAVLLSLLSCRDLGAATPLVGFKAPYFHVQSGDNRILTLNMIKGKVAAIFYENKDIVGANKRLKDELTKLYYEQAGIVQDVLVRLPVIDCSDALWPFWGLWKKKLREHSENEGVTIYCDWNGEMASAYGMRANVSNVVIIDKSGRIRFFSRGEVKDEEIFTVKELLIALARE